jgi:NTP pyrophosphatase (non-canonical NTP hydrolase)
MTKSQIAKCKQIAEAYGISQQLDILCEECAELIQAVSKVRREVPNADDLLADEIADVSIMVTQIISLMDDDDTTKLNKIINTKINNTIFQVGIADFEQKSAFFIFKCKNRVTSVENPAPQKSGAFTYLFTSPFQEFNFIKNNPSLG